MKLYQLDKTKLFGTSGSGNQKKQWISKDLLVKINSKHREAFKEVDAYKLALAFGIDCAKYEAITAKVNGTECRACLTYNFIRVDEEEVKLYYILNTLGVIVTDNTSAIDFLKLTATAISEFTNNNITYGAAEEYLYTIVVFDYIICNMDRHLTNIEILYNSKTDQFRLAPLYDHGQAFLDTDADLGPVEYERRLRKLKSKPFSTNPDRNICEHTKAKYILDRFLSNCSGIDGINLLDIQAGHKHTIIRRIKQLSKLLDT